MWVRGKPQFFVMNARKRVCGLLFKTSRYSVRSAGNAVLHQLPFSIQLNPRISEHPIRVINFVPVMQARAAVSSNDNRTFTEGDEANMVMPKLVHVHLTGSD